MAGTRVPAEGSSSSSEPSRAAAVLHAEQTAAAETSGTKIDHDEPVEDLHEESASHEEAGKSGEETESLRGRMAHDTGGEGGSVTSVPQNDVERGSEMNTSKEHHPNHRVKVESLDGHTQSSEHTVVYIPDDIDDDKVESITNPSVLNTDDKHPNADRNSVDAVKPTAVSGEHDSADTEEGSKPSEEAESVVFKPEAEPAQLTAQSRGLLEVDETNEKDSATVDVLDSKDNRDNLVTDWVTLHQTSKYFETFVESLEDMKELPSNASAGASDYGLLRSASPPQNTTRSKRNEENVEQNKKEREPSLKNSNNDSALPQEKEDVKGEPEVDKNETTVEEIKDLPSPDHSDSEAPQRPGGPSEPTASQPKAQPDDTKETMESKESDNTEVTSVTDLTAVTHLTSSSMSDNGADEGIQNKPQVQSKPSDRSGSLSSENKEVKSIKDFKPAVTKDQLSTCTVEETSLFGRSSYPQFTTQTGSGY